MPEQITIEDPQMTVLVNSETVEVLTVGVQGPPGPQGETGPAGTPGAGVATGGTTGQILTKASDADYDTEWETPTPPVSDHAELTNLDYASAGHVGFAGTGVGNIFTEAQVIARQVTLRYTPSDDGAGISIDKDFGPVSLEKASIRYDDATDTLTLAAGGVTIPETGTIGNAHIGITGDTAGYLAVYDIDGVAKVTVDGVTGAVVAVGFIGLGTFLTSLNASNISSGSLTDTRLSNNVALKNQNNLWSVGQTVTGTVTATTFSGSGASLTSIPAGQLTGSIADARLSANVPLLSTANIYTATQTFRSSTAGVKVKLNRVNVSDTGVLLTVNTAVAEGDGALVTISGNGNMDVVGTITAGGLSINSLNTNYLILGTTGGNVPVWTGDNTTRTATCFSFVGSGLSGIVCGPNRSTDIGLVVKGAASQSANLQEWQKSDATVYATVSENGYFTTRKNAAPADAELVAGEAAYWFDSTNGASAFNIKAKQADGTVKTATIPLS